MRLASIATLALLASALALTGAAPAASRASDAKWQAELDRLAAEVAAAEDVRAIEKLQRAYGYYVDKGMWADLASFYTEDAVANYPAGVFIGAASIREHLFMNVGGVKMGEVGLGDGRLYNHMQIQPVIHLDPGGRTAHGRWRALALFGNFGAGAVWAEGVYEMLYAKENGVWKIQKLDYYSGFGAPYQTGWGAQPAAPSSAASTPAPPRRKLAHPADRERHMECEGFPKACIAPFHYSNPGTTPAGHLWMITDADVAAAHASGVAASDPRKQIAELAHRIELLEDEQQIENLQRIYGYYVDRAMWDQVADLFAADGTIEIGLRGVYVGKHRVRQFLDLLGHHGLTEGWLNDHVQLQVIVDVSPDGKTARSRSRELAMTGQYGGPGAWSEGIYENAFVKQNGVWKFSSLHFYPTFITDYDKGWAKDAQPVPTASAALPPDRPPSETYAIYPKAHVPPFHYRNPVTGAPPQYPAVGGPDARMAAAALQPAGRSWNPAPARDVATALPAAQRALQKVKDYYELENLESAYGYYLDKFLWNDLADLFAKDGSIELAQRGIYHGQDHVRAFLLKVFGRGREGPVAGQLANHLQMQPVITLAEDGQSARIRSRVWQQMSFGPRASLGAGVYENEAVKENGLWKLRLDHAYNTFTAGYDGGWAKNANRGMPGPSKDFPPDGPPTARFAMFPVVYDIPFHYSNPVTGRTAVPPIALAPGETAMQDSPPPTFKGMPAEIASTLREIGPRIEVERTAELYVPLLPKEPYAGVLLARDLAYGPHERNVLDVFTSSDRGEGKPVVVFIHGGGFQRGAKHAPGSPFFDNIGLWAVSHGLVGVTVNYRLAPEFQFPSGIEDVTRLVGWLKAHIAEYGGASDKIFLWGHSSGAAHAADYIAQVARSNATPAIAGAILTSGFYDLGHEVSVWKAYYGEDVSRYAERSSLPGLLQTPTPLLVTDAELDPEMFQTEAERLTAQRAQIGKPVLRVYLHGHSHISETYAVGTEDESLSGPVLEFVRAVSAH
jgi:acetyl esterase/lipase